MKISRKGFSTVEILIALLIIGLIGGAGWYIWKINYKTAESGGTTTQTSSTTPATNAGDNYLTIKEWGVRFSVSDEVPYYEFDTENDLNRINVYSTKYNNLTNANGVKCKDADDNTGTTPPKRLRQIVFIRRHTLAEVETNKDDPSYYQYVKEQVTIGNYEYATGYASYYAPGCAIAGSSSSTRDARISTIERQIGDSLVAGFKTLEPVNN